MILMSYDGSADAQAAIDHVAQLMPGARATVVTVWEPFMDALARSGTLGLGTGMGGGALADSSEIDEQSRLRALERAAEGVARATAAGLVAEPRVESRDGDVAGTLLRAAADVDADVIALGTRGLGGVKSFVLGSVSHEVVQHADRAVLVVPSPGLAERRRHPTGHVAVVA